VHTPDEAGRLLGLPVLGVIPAVRHAVANARKQLGRATHLAPNSDVAEAYRTLRAAVYYGWPDRTVKSVLVTSPERGDGKSTTASNLAIAMAQAGLRTLLVDADLRAAVQHKLFEVPNTSGLSDIIARGVSFEHAVRPTEVAGLSLLPSGTPTPAPAEITNGQAFGKLLQQLEQAYDLIVIDSPPLLAVADARILGAQAGLTILTLRAEKSTRQEVMQACQQLHAVGSSILGVVLNGVPQRGRAYGYRYGDDETPARIESNLAPGRALPPGHEPGARALTY
jgi:capsular exopolysaccharide synthesis family protein